MRKLQPGYRLISYAPNLAHMYRRVGIYAGKILNAAKAFGLTVAPSILARAGEVIE